ncbi:MAG: JAB domain-containing protein [Taibaiella sp.]|nr:JAB domain-containing protein [Taibaiella sp.]
MEKSREFDVNRITEVELLYRNPLTPSQRPVVRSAKEAYELFMKNWDMDKIEIQEEFKVMLLNRSCKVLGIFTLALGGPNSVVVDRKLLFATVLKANAGRIILAHNHPSGAYIPSTEDVALTSSLALAAKTLDIQIEDHLIVTRETYYSFKDNGIDLVIT